MKIFIFSVLIFWVSVSFAEEKPFVYDDHGKRDPLWRLVTSSGMIMNYERDLSILDLSLEGVMAGRSGNLAIINGQVVKEKAYIGQFMVVEVKTASVILIQGQQKFELKLKKED